MNEDTKDIDRIAHLEARAESGELKAMFDLGLLHDLPEKPDVPLDLERARHWYTKAAELGHAWAQFALGNMNERAEAGARNQLAARRWYEAAAHQGINEAQFHLGRMLQSGQGGPAEPARAAEWFDRAARQGHEVAATHLALMHLGREIEQADPQRAFELLEFAADKLHGLAHLVLGDVHLNGSAGRPHGGYALVHYCVAVQLLPPGPDAERAERAKEELLARKPELRDDYETQAADFIAARRVPPEATAGVAPVLH